MISIRKANFNDIEFLWYLRNQPGTYKYSRQKQAVSWKEHVKWIMPILLEASNKNIFIIKNLKTPIGQIRLDWMNNKEVEISISILKEFQGKGLASKSLDLAIRQVKKEKKISSLIATVHKENLASRKLFEKLNFQLKEKNQWLKYTLKL